MIKEEHERELLRNKGYEDAKIKAKIEFEKQKQISNKEMNEELIKLHERRNKEKMLK